MKNKMNRVKQTVVILILFLSMGICLWLPSKLFAIGDRQKMGELQKQKTEQIVVQSQNQVSLEEKFKLLYDRVQDLRMISVESKPEEEDRIWEMAKSEVSFLKKNTAIPKSLDMGAEKRSCCRYFVMDARQPEISMYFWILYIGDTNMEVSVGMEEETGKVLAFDLHKFRRPVNEKKIGNGFAAYLQPEINWYMEQTPELYFLCYDDGYAISTGIIAYGNFNQYSFGHSGEFYDKTTRRPYSSLYG